MGFSLAAVRVPAGEATLTPVGQLVGGDAAQSLALVPRDVACTQAPASVTFPLPRGGGPIEVDLSAYPVGLYSACLAAGRAPYTGFVDGISVGVEVRPPLTARPTTVLRSLRAEWRLGGVGALPEGQVGLFGSCQVCPAYACPKGPRMDVRRKYERFAKILI